MRPYDHRPLVTTNWGLSLNDPGNGDPQGARVNGPLGNSLQAELCRTWPTILKAVAIVREGHEVQRSRRRTLPAGNSQRRFAGGGLLGRTQRLV